jgi:hypothetical protein
VLSGSVENSAVIDLINLIISSKAKVGSIVVCISIITDIISVLEMVDIAVSNWLQSNASFRIKMIGFVNAIFLVLNDILLSEYSNNILRSPIRQTDLRMTGKLIYEMTY